MEINEDNEYWTQELDDFNKVDLIKSYENDEFIAIVDGEAGGIVGYMLQSHAERITKALNKYREDNE
jgi:hypothetical protein